MSRHIFLFLLISLLPLTTLANVWEQTYPGSKLLQEKPRFERRLNELYIKGIKPVLTPEESRALSEVQFKFPLIGENSGDPSDFYSYSRDGRSYIALPILSLIFLEDLTTAYAWLWANNYRFETIDEYLAMLKYKSPQEFPAGYYPSPLQALHIPKDALNDPQVNDLSLRFRNTAYAFILLHELGHVLYQHRGYSGITTSQARSQESDADQFALDVLNRTSTIPMGAILYFQAQAYSMPNKGQLIAEGKIKTENDWQAYMKAEMTHPLTSNRLEAMATHMSNTANELTGAAEADTLRFIATRLLHISEILEDTDMQACMAVVAARANPADLAPRSNRDKTKALFELSCQKK